MSSIGSKLHHHSCEHGSRSWCSLRQFAEFESPHHIRHSVLLLSPSPYTTSQEMSEWTLPASPGSSSRYIKDWLLQLNSHRSASSNNSSVDHRSPCRCSDYKKHIPHRDHITPAMRNLHWLPIPVRVTFKLCSLMYNIFSHRAPTYMSSLINARSNQAESRGLRSTSRGDAVVPKTNRNYGKRAFAVAKPTAWNSLPVQIRRANTVKKFKYALKTHLFSIHYPTEDWILFLVVYV